VGLSLADGPRTTFLTLRRLPEPLMYFAIWKSIKKDGPA
jgi:hypothetical protein